MNRLSIHIDFGSETTLEEDVRLGEEIIDFIKNRKTIFRRHDQLHFEVNKNYRSEKDADLQ